MKFRNDREREAWSSAWDFSYPTGIGPEESERCADAKIEAMREREAKPEPEAPVRGERERLEKLLNRLTAQSWTPSGASLPMVDTALMTAFFGKVIAALPPDDQQPAPRSERPALERVRTAVRDVGIGLENGRVHWSTVTAAIDAEIARQPPGDTLAVENLIAKVRLLLSNEGNVAMLRAALAVLDRVRGKA